MDFRFSGHYGNIECALHLIRGITYKKYGMDFRFSGHYGNIECALHLIRGITYKITLRQILSVLHKLV